MDKWTQAINFVLGHEGGYSDNPSDPGGKTNFGITDTDLYIYSKSLNLPSDVKSLTKENAELFYQKVYWDKYQYDLINDNNVAMKVLDMSVNMGPQQAHILAQRAVNRMIANPISVDGRLGPESLKSINSLDPIKYYAMLKEVSVDFYNKLVIEKPTLSVFLRGWLTRANS